MSRTITPFPVRYYPPVSLPQGWRDADLPMTSASDEASKWFDASLTQVHSYKCAMDVYFIL